MFSTVLFSDHFENFYVFLLLIIYLFTFFISVVSVMLILLTTALSLFMPFVLCLKFTQNYENEMCVLLLRFSGFGLALT